MLDSVTSETIDETRIAIRRYTDVVAACQKGQALAEQLGLSDDSQVNVVLTILKVAREIAEYVGRGEIILSPFRQDGEHGIVVKMNGKNNWKVFERSEAHFIR